MHGVVRRNGSEYTDPKRRFRTTYHKMPLFITSVCTWHKQFMETRSVLHKRGAGHPYTVCLTKISKTYARLYYPVHESPYVLLRLHRESAVFLFTDDNFSTFHYQNCNVNAKNVRFLFNWRSSLPLD